jgi:hypothetical protein
VTQGRASGTGRKLWPVGVLYPSAALVLILPLSFAALARLFMLRTSGADSMTSGHGPDMGQTGNMCMAETGPAASMKFLHPATDRGGLSDIRREAMFHDCV